MRFIMQKLIKQNNYHNIKVHQRGKASMKMKINNLIIKKHKTNFQKL